MRPEAIRGGRPVGWALLLTLLLVPILGAATLLGMIRPDRWNANAAIVNLDQGTHVQGQFVPMGRQLGAEMMAYQPSNISWELADAASGAEGLNNGKYAVVVTIPADFSQRVLSFSADADQARQARIIVATSANAPTRDAAAAREVAAIAREVLNSNLTSEYLKNVYIGFNQVGERFGEIVTGAERLRDGTGQLADGAQRAADGTAQLVDGLDQLIAGGDQLVVGGSQLTGGGQQLVVGARQLADGVGKLDGGTNLFAAQLPKLVAGVGQLADGAERLLPGVSEYAQAVPSVLDGVDQLRGGLDRAVSGLSGANAERIGQLVAGAQQLAEGARQLADGLDQLVVGLEPLERLLSDDLIRSVETLAGQVSQLGGQIVALDGRLAGYADGSRPVPDEVLALAEELKSTYVCPVPDEELCKQLRAAYSQGVDDATIKTFRQVARQASAWLRQVDPVTGKTYLELAREVSDSANLEPIVDGLRRAQELFDGVRRLRDGAHGLADGSRQLADGVQQLGQLPGQLGELRDGLTKLSDGARELGTRAAPLREGGAQLAEGATGLLDGVRVLNTQVQGLPAGAEQLADATGRLATGADRLADGVGKLSDGVGAYVAGAAGFVGGVRQAAGGAGTLADGVAELAGGARAVDEGAEEFARRLAEGRAELPSYSEVEAERLAEVVSSPVGAELTGLTTGPAVALVLVVALWVGALGVNTVARPVPSDVVSSRASSLRLWLRTLGLPMLLGATMGVALGLLGVWQLSPTAGVAAGFVALLALLGVVFMLVQHALVGWFGFFGSAASLLLLAATVGLGLSAGAPGWLAAVASLSPLQGGVWITRSWLAGAEVLAPIVALCLACVVFWLASWGSIAARRQLTPKQFARRG